MQFRWFLDKEIKKLNKKTRRKVWHSWFVWYPIRVGPSEVIWLETVLRRAFYHDEVYKESCLITHWEYQVRGREE
jgi:hypothetical protein